jgi:hypothetical protein
VDNGQCKQVAYFLPGKKERFYFRTAKLLQWKNYNKTKLLISFLTDVKETTAVVILPILMKERAATTATSYPGPAAGKALVNAGHVTPKYSQNLGVFLYIIKTPIGSQGEWMLKILIF